MLCVLNHLQKPLIQELEAIDANDIIGTEWTRALVYNKFRWEELTKETEPPEIPEDVRALKTMVRNPFRILTAAFFRTAKLEHLSGQLEVEGGHVHFKEAD